MKEIKQQIIIDLTDFSGKIKMTLKKQTVTISGSRGQLSKNFSHLKTEIKKTGPLSLTITKWWASKHQAACLQTASSAIRNMAIGVTSGFRYKLRTVYAHFPIQMLINKEGSKVTIKNFLGNKHEKTVDMRGQDTVIKVSPKVRDEFWIEGNNLEQVSQSCALISQKAIPRNKDIRKFLDGIYVSEKTTIVKDNLLLGM